MLKEALHTIRNRNSTNMAQLYGMVGRPYLRGAGFRGTRGGQCGGRSAAAYRSPAKCISFRGEELKAAQGHNRTADYTRWAIPANYLHHVTSFSCSSEGYHMLRCWRSLGFTMCIAKTYTAAIVHMGNEAFECLNILVRKDRSTASLPLPRREMRKIHVTKIYITNFILTLFRWRSELTTHCFNMRWST